MENAGMNKTLVKFPQDSGLTRLYWFNPWVLSPGTLWVHGVTPRTSTSDQLLDLVADLCRGGKHVLWVNAEESGTSLAERYRDLAGADALEPRWYTPRLEAELSEPHLVQEIVQAPQPNIIILDALAPPIRGAYSPLKIQRILRQLKNLALRYGLAVFKCLPRPQVESAEASADVLTVPKLQLDTGQVPVEVLKYWDNGIPDGWQSSAVLREVVGGAGC